MKAVRVSLAILALTLPWLGRAVDESATLAKERSLLDALVGIEGPSLGVESVMAAQEISGRVIDAVTRQPIGLAHIVSGEQIKRSDDEGQFRLEAAHGVSALSARAPGYRRWQGAVAQGQGPVTIALQPLQPKAIYISAYGIGHSGLRGDALRLIEQTELNALVIDVKGDRSIVPFKSKALVDAGLGPQTIVTVRDMPAMIRKLHDKGLYLIGRIVVFKDDRLVQAHPEWAVRDAKGEIWRDLEGLSWIDPSRRAAWGPVLALAEEAAQLGFDEIQFDYVRFPDTPGLSFSVPNNQANRTAAISGFLDEAKRRLGRYNVFIAADIFGYACWNQNDTSIGQQLEMLSDRIDYLSPMLYPSGFGQGIPGHTNAVESSYEIVRQSLMVAQQRTGLPGPRWRPWLQAFKDYAFDRRSFGAKEIRAQIDGSEATQSNGWILWNARNRYSAAGLKPRTDLAAKPAAPVKLAAAEAAASAANP